MWILIKDKFLTLPIALSLNELCCGPLFDNIPVTRDR
jgi:hypothetical protein